MKKDKPSYPGDTDKGTAKMAGIKNIPIRKVGKKKGMKKK